MDEAVDKLEDFTIFNGYAEMKCTYFLLSNYLFLFVFVLGASLHVVQDLL